MCWGVGRGVKPSKEFLLSASLYSRKSRYLFVCLIVLYLVKRNTDGKIYIYWVKMKLIETNTKKTIRTYEKEERKKKKSAKDAFLHFLYWLYEWSVSFFDSRLKLLGGLCKLFALWPLMSPNKEFTAVKWRK